MVSKSMVMDVIQEALDDYDVDDPNLACHIIEQLEEIVELYDDVDSDDSNASDS